MFVQGRSRVQSRDQELGCTRRPKNKQEKQIQNQNICWLCIILSLSVFKNYVFFEAVSS